MDNLLLLAQLTDTQNILTCPHAHFLKAAFNYSFSLNRAFILHIFIPFWYTFFPYFHFTYLQTPKKVLQ